MKSRLFPAALLLCAGLSGCADTRSGYPSLAPRPIEREVLQADAVPPVPATAPAPAAPSADIAQIVAGARTADAAFRAALEKARPAIEAGRSAPEGSEAWVAGQQAYSNADVARMPVADALAELDRRREAAVTAGDAAGGAAVAEALGELQQLHEAERALLAALMPA
ncbi:MULTISPECIES: hypothetical protein [unclassified Sphingomonas]|uniref:hypothetical protein n=1 Tax=unclassified Sphingomonas TaxID=196159 RepID=UPI0006FD2365|nr:MULTISPECIES: hypothetical protein [unclassified Sphingomonas]KQX26266.1 hypothetical protein ASD17_02110 [Sphingomonas sp. Root1294]KQY69335.1 hypothetical protein ASD39_03315 [Sphingomonas sp. Root50]KRB89595.1 hypothetical protein ASE22_18230 [Sphingomonas sp. Root720]